MGDDTPRSAADHVVAVLANRSMPESTVIPVLAYEDVGEAIDWLCTTFGFNERWRVGNHRGQLAVGDGCIAVTGGGSGASRATVMVRVADVDAHYEHARQQGAEITGAPTDYPYGERQYNAVDLGGHHWTFSQSIADVAPEEWGGTSGPGLAR
jgi:uncharacterized glyoxalase superfamily protein PhnB